MYRSAGNMKYNFISIINKYIEYFYLFLRVKSVVVKSCLFTFFQLIKEKHCHSPPTIRLFKNKLIGGKEICNMK